MEFDDAIAALEGALRFGVNPSLRGIALLAEQMGRPQDSFASVQVTGTNGKSSTTRMIAALVAGQGLSTGAFTSPHLESYTERIEIGGAAVSETDFAAAITAALDAAARAGESAGDFTEFELLTAAALWLLRERGVDVACLEVGMGGRWDATSVVDPAVAVITGVGLDHTERLGATVEAIAADKSRIIKPGASVVLGPGTAQVAGVFLERAAGFGLHPRFVAEAGARSPVSAELTVRYGIVERPDRPGGTLRLDVSGVHGEYAGLSLTAPGYQAANVATAIAAAECALGRALDLGPVRTSLASMRFPGRFELLALTPPLVIDGAHNPQAASVLATAIVEAWPDAHRRPWCVLGVLGDKDAAGIVRALDPVVARFIVTQTSVARARSAADLATVVERETGVRPEVRPDLADALAYARAHAGAAGVVVTGSLYTAGEARMSPLSR
jgi:dihydrofolate synthase/folylpolyglutamate synthase